VCAAVRIYKAAGPRRTAGLAAEATARRDGESRSRAANSEPDISRSAPARLADGAQLCRRFNHRRKGTQKLRDAPGQPTATGRDRTRQVARLALSLVALDRRFAANRDALSAALWRVALRSSSDVPGPGALGAHIGN